MGMATKKTKKAAKKTLSEQAVDVFTKYYALATNVMAKTAYLHGLAEIGVADERVEKVVLDALNPSFPAMVAIACDTVKCTKLNTDAVVKKLTELFMQGVARKTIANTLAHVAPADTIPIVKGLCNTEHEGMRKIAIDSIVTAVRQEAE